jgi:hypothetical protein
VYVFPNCDKCGCEIRSKHHSTRHRGQCRRKLAELFAAVVRLPLDIALTGPNGADLRRNPDERTLYVVTTPGQDVAPTRESFVDPVAASHVFLASVLGDVPDPEVEEFARQVGLIP